MGAQTAAAIRHARKACVTLLRAAGQEGEHGIDIMIFVRLSTEHLKHV